MIRKRLAMKFKTANGKVFTISLDGPKDGVQEQEIKNAMDLVVSKKIFLVNDSEVATTSEAKIITTDETVHDLVI